ncbi:urate hydroxylase PuuD [Ramlibacter tataouinensis]|uniref:Candidate membrane protein n=1 Tax=Ramlibacter tataouinensis (strain ATCC BAA-407 / DSM 14655 / LMG 21543 / TTB310) TaxID=365046 RepID=F5XY46_RAMTT|nr:urate hydroxylase PuuD [Ramlibacter tataouinensis]AEG94371.1 candidate membrane protein [Ramlibacter tataouinensis TTB310]
MESYLLDWANLLLRWLHVVTAIAWIGSSFYFVFLDASLTPPQDEDLQRQGVSGELWAVHGGGFYHPVKFAVAPPRLPAHLHWFYWESYSTWLSGFALFTVSYLWNAGTYLVDKSLMDWSPGAAVAVALAFLGVFWILYDAICRVFGGRKHGEAIVGALVALLVGIASWLACHWFAGRAAFLLVGAMIATAMSANVLFWIIPGQKKMVASIRAGQPVDPIHGIRGKQRSVHNTYFTLPVLLAMVSNHYSFLWSHPRNWLVLVLLMAAGAAVRQFFVLRHGWKLGRNRHPLAYALAGVAVIAGTAVWLAPRPGAADPAAAGPGAVRAAGPIAYEKLQPVLAQRCYQCHGEQLQMKNVRVDTPQAVKQHAQAIYQQVVVTRLMPMNNATGMTEAERALVGQWFREGARLE